MQDTTYFATTAPAMFALTVLQDYTAPLGIIAGICTATAFVVSVAVLVVDFIGKISKARKKLR